MAHQNTYVVEVYRHGSRVTFPPDSLHFELKNRKERGKILSISRRSLIRGAFMLANAPRDWGAMATLTHRLIPKDPKRALKKFVRAFREDHGTEVQWAWFMEFQKRGAVHFHFFIEKEWLERNNQLNELEIVRRKKCKNETILIHGTFERWIIDTWIRCTGDEHEDAKRFNEGGILEMLRSADGAGRYMASYIGKEDQKALPRGCAPCGRWWAIAQNFKPRPLAFAIAKHWPFPFRYKYVYDSAMLDELVCEARSNYKLPPSDEETGKFPLKFNALEKTDGRWTFVSYDERQLDLIEQARKEVK